MCILAGNIVFSMMYIDAPFGISPLYIYIYDGEFSKIYEISNIFLFVSLSLHEFFFRSMKVE